MIPESHEKKKVNGHLDSLPVRPAGSVELWHEFGFALGVTEHDERAAARLQHAHQPIVGLPAQLMNPELWLDGYLASLVHKGEVGLGHTLLLQLPVRQSFK